MGYQLKFDLEGEKKYSSEDFFVSKSNQEAFSLIGKWPDWPSHCLVIYGEKACGKTHLSHIWQEKSSGVFFNHLFNHRQFSDISKQFLDSNIIIDNAQTCDEKLLLSIYNQSKENKNYLLITYNVDPRSLNFKIKDLKSRILSSIITEISPPDDELIKLLAVKLLSQKGLIVKSEVIEYIAKRIRRSYQAINKTVSKIDEASLSQSKEVTIPLVKNLFGW